ncbi:MAG: hypothetical protein LBG59_05780 [Candidatus Peribacteria bacterium]|jgi:hypothetical protein|nr:hypothetical protein [Candidatus Peribacteria bacterium]
MSEAEQTFILLKINPHLHIIDNPQHGLSIIEQSVIDLYTAEHKIDKWQGKYQKAYYGEMNSFFR